MKKYNTKRDFNKTSEPIGKKAKSGKKLRFVVQHHLARRDHYDLRLEYDGALKSFAVPKGPSYNSKDRRLAVQVEDHPLDYRNFEGTIPKGEYGGGTVMLWDEGYWESVTKPNFNSGSFKFILKGKRLKGCWNLVHFKEDNWLLIKEEDEYYEYEDINEFNKSIRTNRTMEEIEKGTKKKKNIKNILSKIKITNPTKLIYKKSKITKLDVLKYYEKVADRMLPFLENRIISTIRCPEGIEGNIFFKKHLETKSKGIKEIKLQNNNNKKEDYYYITDVTGLLAEAQMNSIEFHIWGSKVKKLEKPDLMVFDLDPDEKLDLKKLRQGVKDLKSILDGFNLKSYLKTSGGKGYHIVVPIKESVSWEEFRGIAKNIAKLMEAKWPDKYTSNMRKDKRKGKIFIDWVRNTRGSTSVAPYSLRARENAPISFPIKWSELDKIKPNEITIKNAIKSLKRVDPWKDFFDN
ncbi:MAG: hypothetical protein E7163_04365 [Firmicutes bacterium]|nr:hypothetical protein [Bacillota bacterium]